MLKFLFGSELLFEKEAMLTFRDKIYITIVIFLPVTIIVILRLMGVIE